MNLNLKLRKTLCGLVVLAFLAIVFSDTTALAFDEELSPGGDYVLVKGI